MLIWKIVISLMGILFKHVQYWLTKEIYRYPIKNQNMFIVYLNVCLHISIWIFIGTVKKSVRKISLLQWFFWYDVFFDNFVNYQWQIQESGHIRKTTKEDKFSAHVFFTMPILPYQRYLHIYSVSQYWKCLNWTPIKWKFSKSAFSWLSSLKIW